MNDRTPNGTDGDQAGTGREKSLMQMIGEALFPPAIFPRQRPSAEWEHVHVTRSGRRYVDVRELLQDERVKTTLRKAAQIEMPWCPGD